MDFLAPKDARTGGAFYSGVHPGREAQYAPKPKPQAAQAPQIPLATFMKVALPFMQSVRDYNVGPQSSPIQAKPKFNYSGGVLGKVLQTPRYKRELDSFNRLQGYGAIGQQCLGGT